MSFACSKQDLTIAKQFFLQHFLVHKYAVNNITDHVNDKMEKQFFFFLEHTTFQQVSMEMVVLNCQKLFHVKQIKNNYPGMAFIQPLFKNL